MVYNIYLVKMKITRIIISHFILLGKLLMWILKTFRLIKWQEDRKGTITCNNLTLINFILINLGPLREPTLTSILITIQVTIHVYTCELNDV